MNVSISNKSVIVDIIYEYFNAYFALPLPKDSNDQQNQNSMRKLKKKFLNKKIVHLRTMFLW